MGYDDVISHMGEFGRYQKRIYFFLCLPAIACAFHEMGGVFLAAKTDFRCLLPEENQQNASFFLPIDLVNISYPWDYKTKGWSQCERYSIDLLDQYDTSPDGNLSSSRPTIKCNSFVYDRSQYTETVTTELNLVCEKAWLRATGDSVFMVGVMVGSIIFSGLSDMYGRRKTLCFVLILQLCGALLVAVSPDFISYMIFRSITGSATSGVFLVAFVIALEIVGPRTRLMAEMGFQLFFTLGYIFVTGLAYFIRSWRILQIAFAVPSIAFLSYWWLVPESIRWLLTRGRLEEAKTLLQKASMENGVELSRETLDNLLSKNCESTPDLKQPSMFDLLRYPNLRRKSLLIFFLWFVNTGTYYGLSWNTSNLGGNEYVNFGISAGVELPAYLFIVLTLDKWGRRITLCGCMLIAGMALLCTPFVPDDMPWIVIALAMFGKFAITASASGLLVFAAEQFPTVIRNIGLGASGICARIGGIIAPHINLLAEVWTPLPLVIFGIALFIAGLLTLLLPETLNTKLPDTIQDGEQIGKEIKRDLEDGSDLKITQLLSARKDIEYEKN